MHSVGRTARAGRSGTCFTLARPEEVKHFKDILLRAENSEQTRLKPDLDRLEEMREVYEEALKRLEEVVAGEGRTSGGAAQSVGGK